MKISSHEELIVFKKSFQLALIIFELTKKFPKEERYSLTDQIRRSSRSVSANIAEAFRKRCYQAAFVSNIVTSEAEAAETQVWLRFASEFKYLEVATINPLISEYEEVIRMLVSMRNTPSKWSITR
jgi:four helix bundle protein